MLGVRFGLLGLGVCREGSGLQVYDLRRGAKRVSTEILVFCFLETDVGCLD